MNLGELTETREITPYPKKEAEEAARRLLAENGQNISALKTRVVCDLEWDAAASADEDE